VILLHDPFAALDATTAGQLSTYLLQEVVRQQQRAVVLSTHCVDLLRDASAILLLQDGEERARGTFAELQAHSAVFQLLLGERLVEKINIGSKERTFVAAKESSSERCNAQILFCSPLLIFIIIICPYFNLHCRSRSRCNSSE